MISIEVRGRTEDGLVAGREDVDPPLDTNFFKKNRISVQSFIDMKK